MADSPAFLVTYPIPEVGMAALRAAGRVHVPAQPPTTQDFRKLCNSRQFDVVVAQLSDLFDAALLTDAKVTSPYTYRWPTPSVTSSTATCGRR